MWIPMLSEVTEAMLQYVNGNDRANQGLGHSTVPEGQAWQKGQLVSSLLPISLTCAHISRMNLEVDRNITMITMCSLNERSMVPENLEITSCKEGNGELSRGRLKTRVSAERLALLIATQKTQWLICLRKEVSTREELRKRDVMGLIASYQGPRPTEVTLTCTIIATPWWDQSEAVWLIGQGIPQLWWTDIENHRNASKYLYPFLYSWTICNHLSLVVYK